MLSMSNGQRSLTILWPAFLMAGVLEMVVFALVDPGDLRWFGGAALDLDARTVYSLAFFVFWAVIALGGALTVLLCSGSDDLDADPAAGSQAR
jgi:hypothetical protein